MWKRVVAPILVVVVAFALMTGCSSGSETAMVSVENPEYYQKFINDNISINVYNWGEYISDGSSTTIYVDGAEVGTVSAAPTLYEGNQAFYQWLNMSIDNFQVGNYFCDMENGLNDGQGMLLEEEVERGLQAQTIDHVPLEFSTEANISKGITSTQGKLYSRCHIALLLSLNLSC
mgnify:CR=1 FL=1